ncbi:uncharacterized protein FIBRA_05228 [Fibroporia radiculosa]|uniref:Uncharacterized protein n=1 Tax=Fibroporia radiculosa TaxID=599839 RepID=J4G8U9_9APHY|nr:uncharacterized protein FIBRA_05228 [Fibroporia radiculosa]CCM03108.1 predicted protein [Fibroporia radiculosa]
MHIAPAHHKRQPSVGLPTNIFGSERLSGSTVATATGLILNTSTVSSVSITAPPLVSSLSLTPAVPTPSTTSLTSPSPSVAPASAVSSGSSISLGTVIGACIGAFSGLALVVAAYYIYSKRTKRAGAPPPRSISDKWKQLDDGGENGRSTAAANVARSPAHHEMEEKNFAMFKKSTPSVRTMHTKTSDEPVDLPPFEFSKYHPDLAKELALEQPTRPFIPQRAGTDSGVSWDGSTVHDDSFLSMRSVRAESGTMSPTVVLAKTTPAAILSPAHKWESAEVLTMEHEQTADARELQNPFADLNEQRRSVSNPFFNAQELQRTAPRSRSRSNSRTSRASHATHSRRASQSTVRQSARISNPFSDVQQVPVYHVEPPPPLHLHGPENLIASGASANAFGDHALRSLIAALDLTQEEVEERLRVASMDASTLSRFSTMTSGTNDTDIGTVREFPMPPDMDRAPP